MFSDATYRDRVRTQVPLRELTTMRVGGPVDYLVDVQSLDELKDVVHRVKTAGARLLPLGEGSNIIVVDEGVRGVAIRLQMADIDIIENDDGILVKVGSGLLWDALVEKMVEQGLGGIEAMSGVPGTVGASPVQNIGCYGQELSDTFVSLEAYDIEQEQLVTFNREQCQFSYRSSIFKTATDHRYIILSVTFKLYRTQRSAPRYPDVQAYLLEKRITTPTISDIRQAVLSVRHAKSMVLDESDPNTRSVGSFFTNPIVTVEQSNTLLQTYPDMPHYSLPDGMVKIPAAWLVERAGFVKGYTDGNVGISSRHSLAVINKGNATADEVISLGHAIESQVGKVFGIKLQREPQIIS